MHHYFEDDLHGAKLTGEANSSIRPVDSAVVVIEREIEAVG